MGNNANHVNGSLEDIDGSLTNIHTKRRYQMKSFYLKHEDIILPAVMLGIVIAGWLTPFWAYLYFSH